MKLLRCLIGLCFLFPPDGIAQSYKFYYSDQVKFLKQNNDTMQLPFVGGLNAPQFSNMDFDQDGVKDVFIFDRPGNHAVVLINRNGKYVHAPEFEGRFPYMTDWCVLRDYDGDGKPDIFTEVSLDRNNLVDTLRRAYTGGVRILKNVSTAADGLRFKQLTNQVMDTGGVYPWGLKKDRERIEINTTDIAGIDDLDGDGDADILAFQSTGLTPYYYENYMKNKHHLSYSFDSTRFVFRDQCWGYMQYNAFTGKNIFALNLGQEDVSECFFQMYEKKAHASNTMFMIDYNGDGVKDIVYGDGGFNNLILLVNGRNLNSLGRDSIIQQDTAFPSGTTPAQFIVFPTGYYVDMDGDGVNELLVTTNEPVAAKNVNNVWLYENKGTTEQPQLDYKGNDFFVYNESVDLGMRAAPAIADLDGDGDEDLVVATSGNFEYTKNIYDRLVIYTNKNAAGQSVFSLADTNFMELCKDIPVLNMNPCFGDLNGDNKPDMLIGDASGQLMYLTNQSSASSISFSIQTRSFSNIDVGSYSFPAIGDIDHDGKNDLVIGNRDGYLKYYHNTGTAQSPQFSSSPTIDSFGKVLVNDGYTDISGVPVVFQYGYASPALYDLDHDGTLELLVGSDGGKVFLYTGVTSDQGVAFPLQSELFVDYSEMENARSLRFGARSSVAVGSLDGDEKPDLMIGNLRGGLNYYSSMNTHEPLLNGIEDAGKRDDHVFTLYPNPASGELRIDAHNLKDDAVFNLYDQVGRSMLSGKLSRFYADHTISLEGLVPGIYIVSFSFGNSTETRKLVIMK